MNYMNMLSKQSKNASAVYKCHRNSQRAGFTLVEILVVVVIISIAAMMAIPLMTSGGTMQLRSAANMIAADIEYAKSISISRGEPFTVNFDAANETYKITDQDGNLISHPIKKGTDYQVDFQTTENLSQVDISAVDFGGSSEVSFDSLGTPSSGGTIEVVAGESTRTITIEPVTGFVSVN